jgi:hypothetical protein
LTFDSLEHQRSDKAHEHNDFDLGSSPSQPIVNVEGYTDVSGSVKISSLPYDAVLKVKICDDRRCADLYPASTGFGGTNYLGLMVVPTK